MEKNQIITRFGKPLIIHTNTAEHFDMVTIVKRECSMPKNRIQIRFGEDQVFINRSLAEHFDMARSVDERDNPTNK